MSKEIWLGPVLGNNRERLLAKCAESIEKGEADRLIYIAASHPLLDLVTEKLLDGKSSRGVWGEFPVYLFRGFVRRILSEAIGLLPRVAIDREEIPLRHSLISQIIKQLSSAGKLKAIRPLANRDGCVNTIASLIGEIQRAGKTPDEFQSAIESRAFESEAGSPKSNVQSPKSQIDFDREVAMIYAAYSESLERFGLTDEDADQLRALQILRGEIEAQAVALPWLAQIDLLVLDGFFDFTPVQGEILKHLIPPIPNVIVNLNGDTRNEDIFRPFQSTIEHLQSIASFELETNKNSIRVSDVLSPLRERLFNAEDRGSGPTVEEDSSPQQSGDDIQPRMTGNRPKATPADRKTSAGDPGDAGAPMLQLLECSDRELEIRSIAKEIKRLVLAEDYKLSNIALVVRERAAYADTIVRVLENESIPCNLALRVEAPDVPAVRACGKLFQLLKQPREQVENPKASDIAHLIKADYFRLSRERLDELNRSFDQAYDSLLGGDDGPSATISNEKLRRRLGIGEWRPDDLENVIAYVGSELRINAWIDRARKLIRLFPSPEDARSLIMNREDDPVAAAADEAPPEDAAAMDRRKKPTPIHPAAIAWSVLVMKQLQRLMAALPAEAMPEEFRCALMGLLDQLSFSNQINRPFNGRNKLLDVPQATVDVRGLESLRRALAAVVRSFGYAHEIASEAQAPGTAGSTPSVGPLPRITLSTFIDEIERSLRSQVLAVGAANRDGLRVLEATDMRGLRFKVVFVAGMIEGGFPLRASRDWLYPHEERVRLQKHGIFLEDISTDTLRKEEHYFYQAVCRATERVYLTRPLALSDGAETVASYYVEEFKRAIAPAEIEVKQIRSEIDGRAITDASTAAELATILIRESEAQNRNARRQQLPRPVLGQLLSGARDRGYLSSSALRRVEVERERNSNWFGPFDGEITNVDLQKMLARHFGPEHVFSASRLSTYGNCSFRFFANRLLRIEPRNEAALDLQAIDAGKLLHDILRRFFEKHRGDYLPARDREALREELAKTADDVFREHEDKVPPLNERIWKIDCEIRKLILDQVLLYELRLQEKIDRRGIRPAFFELAFGRASQASDPKSTTDFLRLRRPDDESDEALIQGQIDRVDLNQTEQVAVAYDYKLSRGATLHDIKAGREVQLPIYLAALEQLFLPRFEVGGGGYYILRGGSNRLNRGLYRSSFADCTNVTYAKGTLDDIEWQRIRRDVSRRVWEFIDGMRGGHFKVSPSLGRKTCKFCDYSAVCRYDAYRISRKRA